MAAVASLTLHPSIQKISTYVCAQVHWVNGANEAISIQIMCTFAYANDINDGSHYRNLIFWQWLFQYSRYKSNKDVYTHVFWVCGSDKPISKVSMCFAYAKLCKLGLLLCKNHIFAYICININDTSILTTSVPRFTG